MISIKAATVLGLAGLGASALGVGAYVESRGDAEDTSLANIDAITVFREIPINVDPSPLVEVTVPTDDVVTLEPVTVYGRNRAARAVRRAREPRALVACSSWQSLETGPAGRRVKSLCPPAAN